MTTTHKRHGDVGMHTVQTIPKTAKLVDPKVCRCAQFGVCGKHLVLAHGEVSGHVHRFDFKTDQIEIREDKDGTIYLTNLSDKDATLVQTHGFDTPVDQAELCRTFADAGLHSPIPEALPAKTAVQIIFPREYDWASREIQRARD